MFKYAQNINGRTKKLINRFLLGSGLEGIRNGEVLFLSVYKLKF